MFLAKLQKDLNQALKQNEKLKVSVLRLLLSAINYVKIAKQHELSDTEITEVIRKEIKKRHEAIALYQQGKRDDLAQKETEELEILLTYLPKQLSAEEMRENVKRIISGLEEEQKGNFGLVMGKVMAELKGKADGGLITKIVKEVL